MTTDTPSLSELVRRLQQLRYDVAAYDTSYKPDRIKNVVVESLSRITEELSRLMAQGGLVGAGATPLEVTDNDLIGAVCVFLKNVPWWQEFWGDTAKQLIALVQTSSSSKPKAQRPSNPIDDGAVERVWQPIETAPKDGTEILAGYFGKPSGRFYFELIRWLDGKWLCRNGLSSYASHWQPLQSPAALEAAEPHP